MSINREMASPIVICTMDTTQVSKGRGNVIHNVTEVC